MFLLLVLIVLLLLRCVTNSRIRRRRKREEKMRQEKESVIEGMSLEELEAELRRTVELPFEDMMIPCPAGTDEYLTVLYGDYMQPPPPEERNPGHPVAWFSMDRSYLDRWWEK